MNADMMQTPPDLKIADTHLEQLEKITTDLLSEQNPPWKRRDAAFRMYELFSGITGVGEQSDSSEDVQDTILPSGKAISPKSAGRCVVEFVRTAKFLKGLNAALLELKTISR